MVYEWHYTFLIHINLEYSFIYIESSLYTGLSVTKNQEQFHNRL